RRRGDDNGRDWRRSIGVFRRPLPQDGGARSCRPGETVGSDGHGGCGLDDSRRAACHADESARFSRARALGRAAGGRLVHPRHRAARSPGKARLQTRPQPNGEEVGMSALRERDAGTRRVLIVCQLDGYANELRPIEIQRFLIAHGHDVQLANTYYLSRASSAPTSRRNKLPSLRPKRTLLYAIEAASLVLTRRWNFGRR